MRITRNIFIILGIIFIAVNLIGYLAGAKPFPENDKVSLANMIGYFIGSNFLFICGCVFLSFANKLNKKIKKKNDRAMVDSLLKNEPNDAENQ